MSLLRRTRTELAGAWRSLRYDMGRAPAEPPADGPDVTSTGMSTFGAIPALAEAEPRPVPHRRPRRALAVTAFGTVTVAGAAGAYLAVVNGLGSLLSETPAAADTFPARPAATANARAAAGPAATGQQPSITTRPVLPAEAPAAGTTTAGAPPAPVAGVGGVTAATPPPPPSSVRTIPASPMQTPRRPGRPECHCATPPPVPTPTAPTSSPSPTPSPSPSSSTTVEPSPSETSATPGESVEPSPSWQGRRHRRHND
ncbi:hypothetical protein [Paractinoplanes deccanensis]|nr:hypothetical protein [Actinoplanes deccanensis]